MTRSTSRPTVTSWWNAGDGVWMRYYGQYTLRVQKRAPGWYEAIVSDTKSPDVRSEVLLAGTLAGAKSKAVQWVSNR